MNKLKLIDKYKYSECDDQFVYFCRVYESTKIGNRVLIERTCVFMGKVSRTWFCPEVQHHKYIKKVLSKKKRNASDVYFGGCAGLGYWFDKYGRKKKL